MAPKLALVLIGLATDSDSTLRWLEAHEGAIECLELSGTGFFARRSPYLGWLADRFACIVRAPALSIGAPGRLSPDRLRSVHDVSEAAGARWIVHPLGFAATDEIRLDAPVPISLTSASLNLVAEHLAQATTALGRPGLIEPIATLLRVPGTIDETDFLNRVCAQTGCRLLVDVTTLLAASRNHDFDPQRWLAEVGPGLIAAARIGGCRFRDGRWRRDADGPVDEAAWTLLREVVSCARPDVVLFAHSRRGDGDGLARDLERLRRLAADAPAWKGRGEPDVAEPVSSPRPPVGDHLRNDGTAAGESEAEHIEIAPDVSFFVLDDEGVFLSEPRQELSLFNTSASLIWCLLEERVAVPEIIAMYQRASGRPPAEAARDVGATLQRWFGLGYTRTPVRAIAPAVPLTTALAQLLTHAPLRQRFRQAPQAVAADLGVDQAESAAFVSLDPDELDAQADEFAYLRSVAQIVAAAASSTDHHVATADFPATARDAERPGPGRARHYRLLTTTFAIGAGSEALRSALHDALAHLHHPTSPADVGLDVRASASGGWVLSNDAGPLRECRDSNEVVPAVMETVREAAVHRHRSLLRVHAGVVSLGRGCLLLPASAGSGKSTLTAGLLRAGAVYYSDEVAILDEGTLAVRPVPLPLSIKDGSVAPLRRLFPEVDGLTTHVREDYQRVRYLPPPAASSAGDQAEPVRWLVFPHYNPSAPTALRPLSRPAGLRKLLDESLVLTERLDRNLAAALVGWMRTVDCYELSMSSLDTSVGLLRRMMQDEPGRARLDRE